ncbi:MAG: thioredoxin family protein [Armatimonadetes bacterium]|nr:thioredoxin family protein [Armatimonadota bacterium]
MRDTFRGLAMVVACGAAVCAAWASWQGSRPVPQTHQPERSMMLPDGFKGFRNSIPHGKSLRLEDHLAKGRITVIEFGHKTCSGCRMFARRLAELDDRRKDLVVKTVEIEPGVGDAGPGTIAGDYHITTTPAFRVYGPDGKLRSEGDAATTSVNDMLHAAKL